LELQDKKSVIIKVLQELDPDITDILTLSIEGMTQLYLRVKGQLIPLQFAGDGVAKILNICLAIMEKKNGLVLIDELETGFHFSMYSKIWKMIDRLSQESNCQVIATTHSYENIIGAMEGLKDYPEDFSFYRLGYDKNGLKSFRFSYDLLKSALRSDMEVR
jgi:AAA15 family ATPase/GTPase